MLNDSAELPIYTSDNTPLRVDFLPGVDRVDLSGGLLGMMHAPGKKLLSIRSGFYDRDLEKDLIRLKEHYNIDTIVTLNEDHELAQLHIPDLRSKITELNMESLQFQITDMSTPTSEDGNKFVSLVLQVVTRLKAGKRVAVHCKAGKGRTGLFVACCLVSMGMMPRNAVEIVRRARAGTIQTWSQEKYVKDFLDLALFTNASIVV